MTNTTKTSPARTTSHPATTAAPTDPSVMKSLRSLMPARVLTYNEALQRAELQASRLLSLHGIAHGPVPVEVVTELPRLRVVQAYDLPVSGSAHWDGGSWVLTVNAAEFGMRQRFSLMHEFKHVLDHPTRHLIQGDPTRKLDAADMAEKVADYFAACVLMPKAWVKSAFCSGIQHTEALAELFQVSPKAMSFRLHQLGLTVPADRCTNPTAKLAPMPHRRRAWSPVQGYRHHRYNRSLPTADLVPRGVLQ